MRFNSRGREGLVWLACVWVIWIARVHLGYFRVHNLFFLKALARGLARPSPPGLRAKRGGPKRFTGLKFQLSPAFLENGPGPI